MDIEDLDKSILSNNLYGVDLNSESVEITKLSLWIKTANRYTQLTILKDNIKCGNSLVDDPAVAGDKAFNWEEEFPEIMKKRRFDVVIGNPPYGAEFNNNEKKYYIRIFHHQSYQLDSYLLFTEKTNSLIKIGGYIGFIMPNTWLTTLLTKEIRRFVFSTFSVFEIRHYSYFVFDNATVETDIYIFKAEIPIDVKVKINIINKGTTLSRSIEQTEWINKDGLPINIFEMDSIQPLKEKLETWEKLGNIVSIVQGVKPFQKGKGRPPQNEEIMKTKPYVQEYKKDDSFIPLLRGSLINRYCNFWNRDYWISYGDWLAEPRYSAKFDCAEKLVIRQTGDSLIACYDSEQFVCRDNLYIIRAEKNEINIKFILAILNSHLLTWYYRYVLNPEKGKAMAQVKRGHIQELPIAQPDDTVKIVRLVNEIIIKLNRMNGIINDLINYISSQFAAIQISKKLRNWNRLEFGDFIKELKKTSGAKLAKLDEIEWMKVFDKKKLEVVEKQIEIDKTDREIDQLVYQLYGLTEEEIKLVESTTK